MCSASIAAAPGTAVAASRERSGQAVGLAGPRYGGGTGQVARAARLGRRTRHRLSTKGSRPIRARTPNGSRARANQRVGPWSQRRGFDSLVQAASGISILEGRDALLGRLPAQALDHASGYLLAAGIVSELTARAGGSGTAAPVDVALARTAAWLTELSGREPEHGTAVLPPSECAVTHGSVTAARPVFDDYSDYAYPAHVWGSDDAVWLPH